jgi:hypothetical protein
MNTPNEGTFSENSSSEVHRESQTGEHLIRLVNSNDLKGFEGLMIGLKGYDILKVADKKLYTCNKKFDYITKKLFSVAYLLFE